MSENAHPPIEDTSADLVDEDQLEPGKSLVPIEETDGRSKVDYLFSWVYSIFGRKKNGATIREDLEDALLEGQGIAEGFSLDERNMLTSILRLRDVRVQDLMVPRGDIMAVTEDITLAELLKIFEESGHSRMPVYGETLDDPKGMVHIRDVVAHITKTSSLTKAEAAKRKTKLPANLDFKKVSLAKPISSLKLLREVMFVPPSMGARELMARMQADRKQIALVIDEYGGTDGLVTLEDIVEEIVGEIEDEHDDEDVLIKDKGDGTFICDAKAELDDIRELLGDEFVFGEHEEDIDTIGGLIFDITGRVPVRGEVISNNGFEFRILAADPRRIKRVELLKSSRRRVKRI
jgi:CBS domain containing-hemolysin-like protein